MKKKMKKNIIKSHELINIFNFNSWFFIMYETME